MNLMLFDNDAELTRLLAGVLEADGMWVVAYSDPAEAVAGAVDGEWVAALVNLDLPDGAAEVFLEVLGDLEDVNLPVVLTSAQHKEHSGEVQRVMDLFDTRLFLRKPIPLLDLNDMLRKARESGGKLEAPRALGKTPSSSVDTGQPDLNEVGFEPASVSIPISEVLLAGQSSRREASKGALQGLAKAREGIEPLDNALDVGELEPLSVAPEELQELPSLSPPAFELEIEDEEDEDNSVNRLSP